MAQASLGDSLSSGFRAGRAEFRFLFFSISGISKDGVPGATSASPASELKASAASQGAKWHRGRVLITGGGFGSAM